MLSIFVTLAKQRNINNYHGPNKLVPCFPIYLKFTFME